MVAPASIPTLPILGTKLYIPPPAPKVALRTRLIERLNEALHRVPGVTLISALAGFGKTGSAQLRGQNINVTLNDTCTALGSVQCR